MGGLFRRCLRGFSQIAGRVAEILLAKAVELLWGGKVELVDDVCQRDKCLREPVSDVFRPLHYQPLVNRNTELFLEYPAERMYSVTA